MPQQKGSEAQESAKAAYGFISLFFAAALVVGLFGLAIAGEIHTWRGWVVGTLSCWAFGVAIIASVNLVRHGRLYRPSDE